MPERGANAVPGSVTPEELAMECLDWRRRRSDDWRDRLAPHERVNVSAPADIAIRIATAIREAVRMEREAIIRTFRLCLREHSATAGEAKGMENAIAVIEARGR